MSVDLTACVNMGLGDGLRGARDGGEAPETFLIPPECYSYFHLPYFRFSAVFPIRHNQCYQLIRCCSKCLDKIKAEVQVGSY